MTGIRMNRSGMGSAKTASQAGRKMPRGPMSDSQPLGQLGQLLLLLLSFGAGFGKPGALDDDRADALFPQVDQNLPDGRRGNDPHGQVNPPGQPGDGGDDFFPLNLTPLGIHQVSPFLPAVFLPKKGNSVAKTRRTGGADESYGSGSKELIQDGKLHSISFS
ncbi:MAG: hypothetical protein AMJ94_07970 [Deltaproteobacteria bacterium SM23_61]|nr:MAG: hypothetical protein AMJ94_07970 [Deltaproteobacteria bacterium SM23_61]